MAKCPFAIQKILPESATQPKIKPRAYIQHSAGGQAELYGWWQSDASHGLESHFFVAGDKTPGFNDGDLIQYMDTETRADANGEANGYAISCESASTVNASEPWTPKQVATIERLIRWLISVHPDIAARQMRTPQDAGLGWHVMFGAPGPWTKARGKVCPGPARIVQFRDQIIPAIANPAPPQEDDMTPAQEAKIDALTKSVAALTAKVAEIDNELTSTRDSKAPKGASINHEVVATRQDVAAIRKHLKA